MRGMLGNISLSAWQGPRDDFETKLVGEDGEKWLIAFKKFLRKENPWSTSSFPTWQILPLGRPCSAYAYRAAFLANGYEIGGYANEILDRVKIAETETGAKLVQVTVKDLGFKNSATYDEIVSRAKELCLDLCPAEVGPKLCLEYGDQPKDEPLTIAMEPIVGSDGDRHVFFVVRSNDGERWLGTYCVNSGLRWSLDNRFVFLSRT